MLNIYENEAKTDWGEQLHHADAQQTDNFPTVDWLTHQNSSPKWVKSSIPATAKSFHCARH